MSVIPRVSDNLATGLIRIKESPNTGKIPLPAAYPIPLACGIIGGLGPITPNSYWAHERKSHGN